MNRNSWMRCGAIAAGLGICASALANSYTIVDLGPVFGAQAINNRGVIAGNPPARWRDGRWRLLAYEGVGAAINEPGDIAGWSYSPGDTRWPIVWPRPQKGDAWFLNLPAGATAGEASAIADDGTVVGSFEESIGGSHCFAASDGHVAADLNWPGGQNRFCAANGINHQGVIVGDASHGSDGVGFIWQDGRFQELQPLPGDSEVGAHAINDEGDVIGVSTSDFGQQRGVLWHDGIGSQVGPSKGYRHLFLRAINNHGEIVGYGLPPRNHGDGYIALRFEGDRAVVLTTEIVNLDDWKLDFALDINDDGVIVGLGERRNVSQAMGGSTSHGFALYPVH